MATALLGRVPMLRSVLRLNAVVQQQSSVVSKVWAPGLYHRPGWGGLDNRVLIVAPIRPYTVGILQSHRAEELWKSVMAEGGSSSKKGRERKGKRTKRKNLNRDRVVGEGKAGILWPGLNAPIMTRGELQKIKKVPFDPEKEAAIIQKRDDIDRKRRYKLPGERGWTSASWGGRSIGPPDPVDGRSFEDFDSRVIDVKYVFNMTASYGRKRTASAIVVVGNGRGLAGFAMGKAPNITAALRKAKNHAVKKLQYVERCDGHTVYHNSAAEYRQTYIKLVKKNRGYGLRCHRALIEICKLVGITDLFAKVDGSTNPMNVVRCFFDGLSLQKTHAELADEKGLHIVEFRKERGCLPIVRASPALVREDPEVETFTRTSTMVMDMRDYYTLKPSLFVRRGQLIPSAFATDQ